MSQLRTGGRTITSNIVRITLTVGIIVALSATLVGIIGASRLASRGLFSEQHAEVQAAEEDVEMYIARAEATVNVAAAAVSPASTTTTQAVSGLQSAFRGAGGSVDRLVVTDASGSILGAYPASRTGPIPSAVLGRAAEESIFIVEAHSPGEKPEVWVGRAVIAKGPKRLVVLGQVHSERLQALADAAAAQVVGGSVLVIGPGNRVVASGGPALSLDSARWKTSNDVTVGSINTVSGTEMRAIIDEIEGVSGLGWSVIVATPETAVLTATIRAVAPSAIVLVLGGLMALAVAWVVSAQLSDPLRSLEEAAYQAAEGSYVKPLKSDRDDEVGRVAEAFNAVAMRLNALHDLSQLLASSTRLDQVLDGILSAMGHIIGPGITAIYLLDTDRRLLTPVRARGASADVLPSLPAVDGTWVFEALDAMEPRVITGPPGRLGNLLPGLAGTQAREAIAIPLTSGYETLGAIVFVTEIERGFTEGETEMLRTFAAQAAVAVGNSRMFADQRQSREIAEALQAVAEDLAAPGNLASSLDVVLERIRQLFDAREITLAIVDRESLGMAAASEPEEEAEIVAMAKRSLALGDATSPTTVPHGVDEVADRLLDATGASEMLVVPIGLSTDHGAVLLMVAGAGGIRGRDVELAAAVSDEIALALDNAYFYERALTRASNLETIFRISQALSSSLQFNIVLNRVLDVVQKIFAADGVWLMNYDRPRRVLRTEMARGTVSSDILDLTLATGEDVQGEVFESGEPMTLDEIPEGSGGVQGIAYDLGLRSMIVVPLLARGRSIGVLSILAAAPNAFSTEDLSVMQTFAAQAALSMDTARLYSREHEVATILQKSITPEALPQLDELETGSVYVPVGPDNDIGGDYCDLIRAADGSIVFAIGDVVGKGVIAATKTSMIKYSVRALVAAGLRPAQVIAEVNRLVAESGDPGDIVTLWLGRYDADIGELSWSSGGHPPGLLRRASTGEIESLAATGPLLGVIPGVRFDELSTKVEPDDICLLYTDGVTEARAGTKFFGERRVHNALAEGGSCDEIVLRLLSSVRMFTDTELRDDVAIVAVRFTGARSEESTQAGAPIAARRESISQ